MPQPTTLRYYADFISRRGRHWHIEILQDHTRGNLHKVYPQELSLPAYEPLVIEWDEAARHDPLRPSRATLTAESPTDRTFLHLFQAPAGSVLLNVYYHTTPHSATPTLYWQGYLDPELYEEPYTRASGYDVMLTFTDLGILSRMTPRIWNRAYTPIRSLIRSIISRAGLQNSTDTALCVSYINNNNNTVAHANTDGGPVFHDYVPAAHSATSRQTNSSSTPCATSAKVQTSTHSSHTWHNPTATSSSNTWEKYTASTPHTSTS